MPAENWKPVTGYETFYEVSDRGRVRALFAVGNFHKPGRILKPWITGNGYVQVHLMKPGGKRKAFCIHTLLLEAFLKVRQPRQQCRHLNGLRTDNRLENLIWGTAKRNQADRKIHGTWLAGEKSPSAKLEEPQVLSIREQYKAGSSIDTLGQRFSVDRSTIWHIVTRKTWRHL